MNQPPRCWCGNTDLQPFSAEYLRCAACETLVLRQMPRADVTHVHDDNIDLYGKGYYLSHLQEQYGYPDLQMRARTDLPERCLHWLRTVLKYKLPPGKSLEIGSAHGGFVALMAWAGFDAAGLELSPWLVSLASTTFGVPMLLGPVEDQQIEPGSLGAVALMDVLEHLPDPVGTMQRCLTLLRPDGLLVIQTPRYPEGISHGEMLVQDDHFLKQLKPKEHLYLFSESSVEQLFHRLGAEHLEFEPAMFAHYDMFFVASRAPLTVNSSAEIESALEKSPHGRAVQAMLDLDEGLRDARNRNAGLREQIQESEADRATRLQIIEEQGRQLQESEADRAARLRIIEEQGQRIGEQEQHSAGQAQQIGEHERSIAGQAQQLGEQEQRITELLAERSSLKERADRSNAAWRALHGSRVFRLMRGLGRWGSLEQMLSEAMAVSTTRFDPASGEGANESLPHKAPHQLRRIAVDLTPVLPGGENGGAKLVALALVRELSTLIPECELALLTSDKNHDELAALDAANVRRVCVIRQTGAEAAVMPRPRGLLRDIVADLLFCPFTVPFFYDPSVPTVSIIYDLQYQRYPQFFSPEERYHRDWCFKEACRHADRLVCISEYVRQTVLANGDVETDRVVTIPIGLSDHLRAQDRQNALSVLEQFGLEEDGFLLYPANFWPHKNHRMLFTALGIYRSRHQQSDLKLVCTGAADNQMEDLREAVRRMGLQDVVVFSGFLTENELSALLQSCLAVIIPSLYEGFGMPVLEAMAFEKPVLCSNVTSLPEVAGDAALYFDPGKPGEIADAIERIVADPGLAASLVARGRQRLAMFGGPVQMAQDYLAVFRSVLDGPRQFDDGVHGVYPDGWTQDHVTVTHAPNRGQRELEMVFDVPGRLPKDSVTIKGSSGSGDTETHVIPRGQSATIRRPLSSNGGLLEFVVEPSFCPKSLGMNDDVRTLGCICAACRIVSKDGVQDLLKKSV